MKVQIEKLIYGGEGLAHHNGSTVFVPFVLPQEIVEVAPVERKKKFVRARVEEWLTPSSDRVSAACPHFTLCGGCHYQHIPYEAQLRFKTEILRETLGRIGRIEWSGPIATHASPPWGYRNRAQWKIRLRGSNSKEGLTIGFFRAGSTAVFPVEECPIVSPRLFEAFRALRDVIASGRLPASLREVEAFVDAGDCKLLLNVSLAALPASVGALAKIFRDATPNLESLLVRDLSGENMELFGPGFLHYEVAGHTYRVGHMSFFQVNRFLVEEMARAVAGAAGRGALALDLFAGVGLFTLLLRSNFDRVVGVEANPASARDLEANIVAGRSHAEARNADVEAFLNGWTETPDAVVLDPPRSGLSHGAVARLAKLAPKRIVYVSCEPSTLARDLAAFASAGYVLAEVGLFDMFPQTYHIESLVVLEKRP
jgi:23S rRNA (uracil1939-C5)-methyltransferase